MKPTLCIIQGGGCRQIECATGVLQAMDQSGVHIDYYRGASAGAIVAALHASGLTGESLAEIIRNTPVDELFSASYWQFCKLAIPGVKVDYVYDNSGMKQFIVDHMLAEIAPNVQVSVTRVNDDNSYTSMMVQATPLTVLASASIPEVFPPVMINNFKYIDGGVINNIPTVPIANIPDYDHIYIVLCNQDTNTNKSSWTKVGRSLEMINLTMDREAHQIKSDARWNDLPNVTVIQPPPFRSHLLEWSEENFLIDHAYDYASKLLM